MARAPLMEKWGAGAHGSTYGGSPVPVRRRACHPGGHRVRGAARERGRVRGRSCSTGCGELWRAHPETITDVRGVGLMIGVELRTAELAELVQRRAFERGLLVLECGESSVRVSPPLVITRDQAAPR